MPSQSQAKSPGAQQAEGKPAGNETALVSAEGAAKEGAGSSAGSIASPGGAASEEEEKEFEPTVEMMMNDFDDERTLEEEEALQEDNETDTGKHWSLREKMGGHSGLSQ